MPKKNVSLPTITVVIATYNSENTIDQCLSSVRNQEYPQNKIDIILADGGSKDSTLQRVKKYNVEFINVPPEKQNAEYNKGVGVRRAKGEILLMIDHDNVLPHTKWLQNLIQPFLDHKEIVGVETLRYHYDPKLSLLDRYFALFGAGDPLAFYFGKADRLSFMYDKYNLYGKAKDVGNYYIIKFTAPKIPTLGANGFLVRRKVLIENAKIDGDHFFHIDVNVDLIKKGFNTYASVKDSIIHLTGYKDISNFLYRRALYVKQFHIQTHAARRYGLMFEPEDKWKLVKFVFYSVTIVKPTFDAIRGYLKIQDSAWFLHPFLCLALVFIYGNVIVRNKLENLFRLSSS